MKKWRVTGTDTLDLLTFFKDCSEVPATECTRPDDLHGSIMLQCLIFPVAIDIFISAPLFGSKDFGLCVHESRYNYER